MPGWYVHMEVAKRMVDRLRAGDVPPDFPGGAAAAQQLGELCHQWRNYVALGAIGPDIFFLLPDFKAGTGNVLLHVVDWVREVYEVIDSDFLSKFEKWIGPVSSGAGDILNHVSGDVIGEIGQALQELGAAVQSAVLDLITRLWDWFGVLTSGVPQGFGDTAFFWSDIFHYRKTYSFPRQLLADANSDQIRAFALGWIAHCAGDVTGHPFVNEKCGGPYRLHWQRHHVIENHMDALVYDSQHGATEPYGEFGTSALHFRLAFRKRKDAPYNGADDAPAYDYFTGFPAYDPAPAGDFQRQKLWDLDSGDMPGDLCNHIIATMAKIFGDDPDGQNPPIFDEPRILTDDPQEFRDGNSGRPSVLSMQNTFWTLYHYLKFVTTDGFTPRRPPPPDWIDPGTFNPPPFPGSDSGVGDDTSRGEDPSPDGFNLLDLLLALFAIAVWMVEFGVWLATLPLAVLNQILTMPGREALYYTAVLPAWQLYTALRKPLVMSGFLVPRPEEISTSLIELGISPDGQLESLAAALASPTGMAGGPLPFDEHSGRIPPSDRDADPAYPRAIIADEPSAIANIIGYLGDPFCGNPVQPSEFLRPWMYPDANNAGIPNGWEAPLSHAGPYVQGDDARVLMNHAPGNNVARKDFEKAMTPAETEMFSSAHLPGGRHLGDPVDYSVYLAGVLSGNDPIPDFNLDGDRGYAYHCWDLDRIKGVHHVPMALQEERFTFLEPCTVPEGYCQTEHGPSRHYDPNVNLAIHYEETAPPAGCNPTGVTPTDIKNAGGIPPAGGRG
jgi:Zinc dependent phospholipase C